MPMFESRAVGPSSLTVSEEAWRAVISAVADGLKQQFATSEEVSPALTRLSILLDAHEDGMGFSASTTGSTQKTNDAHRVTRCAFRNVAVLYTVLFAIYHCADAGGLVAIAPAST